MTTTPNPTPAEVAARLLNAVPLVDRMPRPPRIYISISDRDAIVVWLEQVEALKEIKEQQWQEIQQLRAALGELREKLGHKWAPEVAR